MTENGVRETRNERTVNSHQNTHRGLRIASSSARLALSALAALAASGCMKQIPPASVGIRFDPGSGISQSLVRPQVVWLRFREQLIIYPTSIRNATYTKGGTEGERAGDDSIPASTVEGSILPVDVTVSYHVEPGDVVKTFGNFGTEDLEDVQKVFIRNTTIYAVNVVTGQRSIFDLTSKDRAAFSGQIKAIVAPILLGWGITVDDVFVGEVYPNAEVKAKVEERIAMRNGLELAKVGLQRAQIDAETTLTNARKDAQLNALLAQQGEKTLELRRLELLRKAIEKWDGKAPLLGGNAIPFTNMAPTQ